MGHMGNGVLGVWGIWAMRPTGGIGYRGMGHMGNRGTGVWGTGGMGHVGNGVQEYGTHGQWGPWAIAPRISKRCQVVKKSQMSKNQTPRLWRRFTKKLN